MQKSLIERVFPKPKRSILPLYDESPNYQDEENTSSHAAIRLQNDVSSSRLSMTSSGSKTSLKAAPLSASVVHHNDPFLAVDRAAQNLQRTIQSLLDFQSQNLSGRTQENAENNASYQSTSGHSDYVSSVAGTIPIRQPKKTKLSLRGARRGLVKSMQEFAALQEEELHIIEAERTRRRNALDRISELETRREAVEHEIQSFREHSSNNNGHTFRSEAGQIEKEIHELEGRLMELKARHRHLIRRAEQVENTTASELSSYEGTLKLVEKETRAFLRRPPVSQALSPRGASIVETDTNMYILTADRRNLAMAKEQWSNELNILAMQEKDVVRDREALLEGAEIWKATTVRVEAFEQDLRTQMKTTSQSSAKDKSAEEANSIASILRSLDDTAIFLHQQLEKAESQNWNLLICAIGAELEAFREARALLAPNEPTFTLNGDHGHIEGDTQTTTTNPESESENSDIPHADLLSDGEYLAERISAGMGGPLINTITANEDLEGSNESLKATLRDLPSSQKASIGGTVVAIPRSEDTNANTNKPQRSATTYSESEDDDVPGPEFLISHQ